MCGGELLRTGSLLKHLAKALPTSTPRAVSYVYTLGGGVQTILTTATLTAESFQFFTRKKQCLNILAAREGLFIHGATTSVFFLCFRTYIHISRH